MEIIVYSILIFIFGLCFGSFFNVIGYRLPNNMSIAFPSSHCPKCNHKLGKLELIPVFSYIFQKGRCKYCKEKISILYPIFELLTAILFTLSYLLYKDVYPEVLNIIFAILFTSSMIIIMICDIRYMIIPNEIIIFFSVILIILKLFILYKNEVFIGLKSMGYELIFILLDGFIMFMIMYLIRKFGNLLFKKDSMGGGDIKMMTFVSFILGYKLSIVVVFLASFLALPISIFTMYKKNEHMIPFGPYLAVSSLIIFLSKIDFNFIINLLY